MIHSWPLCFPGLKGQYQELMHMQAKVFGGGKLNLYMPLPMSLCFYFHGGFLYYLSTLEILNATTKYGPAHIFQVSTCRWSPFPEPQKLWWCSFTPTPSFSSPLPPGTMGLSCQGSRVRGHGIPLSCQIWGQIPRPLLHWAKSRSSLAPCNPSRESGNLSKRSLRGISSSKTHLSQPFFFLLSSFIFFFFSTQKGTGLYGKLTALVYGSCMWEPVSVCTQGQCWILQQLLLS